MKQSGFKKKIGFYLWVGLAWIILWLITYLHNEEHIYHFLINEIWRTVYIITINFLFFEYAWPSITRKRRFVIYNILLGIFLFWLLMMLMSFGLTGWRFLGIGIGIYTNLLTDTSISHIIEEQTSGGVLSLFFFGIIKHIYDYRKLKISTQQLRIEKQQAELSYLKSQTNPHFLFNTLNNIYSLARDKSDLAPESILRLSKILRYMLYETSGKYIAIEQEIKIITDYLALEKLRYDESLSVNFHYDVEDPKQALTPLLLIPLVENAFKHGVSETRGSPFVEISLMAQNRQLVFTVKNSTEPADPNFTVRENIGLSNLRRQLELLYSDYNLTVEQKATVFIANLKINLASHV